jgi:hypothetical protein
LSAIDVLMVDGFYLGKLTLKVERLARAKTELCQEDLIDPLSHT